MASLIHNRLFKQLSYSADTETRLQNCTHLAGFSKKLMLTAPVGRSANFNVPGPPGALQGSQSASVCLGVAPGACLTPDPHNSVFVLLESPV